MFAPAPNLPPCGANPAASRTWADVYNALTNQHLQGFCVLSAPVQLQRLRFATSAATKPKLVYIT